MNKNMYDRPNHCYLSSSLNLCHSLSFLEEQLRVIPMRAFVLVIQPLLLPDVHKKIDHLLQFHDPGSSNAQYIKGIIREKSGLHSPTIVKVRFSTFNYETGQHRPSNCQNRANLAPRVVLKVVFHFVRIKNIQFYTKKIYK